ncbi:MAG: DsrE family protein [Methanothrix sp.]|jgi:tRNA 2-thiouridine synthesizing protein B|nr:DsrE family protein [Methanothrix sp.]
MRVFLLTKTPQSERTRLCLRLVAKSPDALVYLTGDGVYNLLDKAEAGKAGQSNRTAQAGLEDDDQALASLVPRQRIMACREDMEARSVHADGKATVPADFYENLVDDMMREGNRIYTF